VRELRAALDAERENVAFVEQTAADFQALWRTACDQREVFETQLSQLQALVRALCGDFHLEETYKAYDEARKFEIDGDTHGWNFHQGRASGLIRSQFVVRELMRKHSIEPNTYATLDATTPAKGQE
jgi:hypothetical protein